MGTRHTYRIIETYKSNNPELGQVSEPICLIYGQYDGYPSGTPIQVAKFIESGKMVNGYGPDSKEIVFNGTGCMTAQLIKHLKDGTGNIYVQASSVILIQRKLLWLLMTGKINNYLKVLSNSSLKSLKRKTK